MHEREDGEILTCTESRRIDPNKYIRRFLRMDLGLPWVVTDVDKCWTRRRRARSKRTVKCWTANLESVDDDGERRTVPGAGAEFR
jgi:hypothetical protein